MSTNRQAKRETQEGPDPRLIEDAARQPGVRSIFSRLFGIDYRSLALFRVLLGITLLYDLCTQAPVFLTFHTRGGANDPQALATYYAGVWNWSVFWWSDAPAFRILLFALLGAASICLVLGWRTRVACITGWILVTSLNDDFPPLTSAADGLLALLLFWSMFLPLGRRWALDARNLPSPPAPVVVSVATAGVLLQMAMMYIFSGVGKFTPPWLDGSALGLVLTNPNVTRQAGAMLAQWELIPRALTRCTLAAELVLPCLMFSPWKTTSFRSGALLGLIAMHVGIHLTMRVLMFSVVALAGLACFIPSAWWDALPLNRLASLCDQAFSFADARHSNNESMAAPRPAGPIAKAYKLLCAIVLRTMLAAVIVYCLAYNLIDNFAPPGMAQRLIWWQQVGVALKMTQRWSMFYDPRNQCFEAAVIGKKSDGAYVDLFRPGRVVTDRTSPPTHPGRYPCERILQLVLTLPNQMYIPFRRAFVENVAQRWNADAEPRDQLVEVYLTYYPRPPHEMAAYRYIDMWRASLEPQTKPNRP